MELPPASPPSRSSSGSTPCCFAPSSIPPFWSLDPAANRYRAVVFGVDGYDEEDTYEDHGDDIRALRAAAGRRAEAVRA